MWVLYLMAVELFVAEWGPQTESQLTASVQIACKDQLPMPMFIIEVNNVWLSRRKGYLQL
jgi:hypothetical protein